MLIIDSGKAGKEIIHDVIVTVGTSMAKDYVKAKIGGKRPRGRPRKHHHSVDGAGFWGDVCHGIKKGAKYVGHAVAPIAKEVFHDVIVPVGTSMAKDYVKSKMGGKRPRGTPRKHHHSVDGAGFWGDVGHGIKKGAKTVGHAVATIAKKVFHDVILPVWSLIPI